MSLNTKSRCLRLFSVQWKICHPLFTKIQKQIRKLLENVIENGSEVWMTLLYLMVYTTVLGLVKYLYNCQTVPGAIIVSFSVWFTFVFMYSLRILGARCSSVVRAFAHGAMGHRIDPSWGGPIELFLVPASAPRLV